MYFLGWMSLAGAEVWNIQRTLTYVRANLPTLDMSGCDECATLALALGDSPYKNNPVDDNAPWIADDEPDLNDFYGFYPMSMEGLYDHTLTATVTQMSGDGGFISTPRHQTKDIRVTGVLLARTQIALVKGRAWLNNALSGSRCLNSGPGCNGDDLCFFATCPADSAEGDYYLRTVRDVALIEGPNVVETYDKLPSGAWMDLMEFNLVAATPFIYGPLDYLGSTMGTSDTTVPINPLVVVGETHGSMSQVENTVTLPQGVGVGDLLVLAWGSDYPRTQPLPGDWQIIARDYENYFSGEVAWKIATASDIAVPTVTVTVAGTAGGSWTCSAYQAGTFHTDRASTAARAAICAPPTSGQKIESLTDSFDRITPDVMAEPGYDELVIADGPISYWKMGEDSGPLVADTLGWVPLSFGNTTGVLRGEPAIAPGLGPSLRVSDGNHGTLTGHAPTELRPPLTWEGWVSPNTIGYPSAGFVNNWPGWFVIELTDSTYEGRYDQFVVIIEEVLRRRATPSDAPETPEATETPEALRASVQVNLQPKITTVDTVQHLVVVVDATNVTLYQNGALLETVPHGLSNLLFWGPGSSARFMLGNAEWNDTFRGRASNWAVYDKALTAEQVANHWAKGNTTPPPVPPTPSQIDPAKWQVLDGTVTWSNGRVALTEAPAPHYTTLASVEAFDLRDSQAHIQVEPLPGQGSVTTLSLASSVAGNTEAIRFVAINIAGNRYLYYTINDGGDYSEVGETYNPTLHAWWRIRMARGVVYWETSPDGKDWTVRRTATPDSTFDSVNMQVYLDPMPDATPDTAYLDNVNVVPSMPLRLVQHFIKGTSTGTLPQAMAPFTSSPGALASYFVSRNVGAMAEALTCSTGEKQWATSLTTNGNIVTNSALYMEYSPAETTRLVVWSAAPSGVLTQDGAYYLNLEVLPNSVPGLALDSQPPRLPECPYIPPLTIVDPEAPTVPPPPRPPSVSNSLQPPAPYMSGYSLFIPAERVPESLDAVLIITLTTGADAARWVRLRLYAAPLGYQQKLEDLDPCSFCGDITVTYIPPNSKFVIDGMSQVVYIEDTAGNQYSASHLVFSGTGQPAQWASVTCGMDYWLAVEFTGTERQVNMFFVNGGWAGQPDKVIDSSTFTVDLGGWTNGFYDGSPRAVLARDTAQFESTPASMRVNWPVGSTDRPQVVIGNLTAGRTYIMSMWVKSPTARISLSLEQGGTIQAPLSPVWEYVEGVVTASATTMIASLSRDTTQASGDIWVDDFSLRDAEIASYSVVKIDLATARRE